MALREHVDLQDLEPREGFPQKVMRRIHRSLPPLTPRKASRCRPLLAFTPMFDVATAMSGVLTESASEAQLICARPNEV